MLKRRRARQAKEKRKQGASVLSEFANLLYFMNSTKCHFYGYKYVSSAKRLLMATFPYRNYKALRYILSLKKILTFDTTIFCSS